MAKLRKLTVLDKNHHKNHYIYNPDLVISSPSAAVIGKSQKAKPGGKAYQRGLVIGGISKEVGEKMKAAKEKAKRPKN